MAEAVERRGEHPVDRHRKEERPLPDAEDLDGEELQGDEEGILQYQLPHRDLSTKR